MPFSNLMQHTLITFATEDEVGLESKGDIAGRAAHVRSAPRSGHQSHAPACLTWAKSRSASALYAEIPLISGRRTKAAFRVKHRLLLVSLY
jgi:hypothetical protein